MCTIHVWGSDGRPSVIIAAVFISGVGMQRGGRPMWKILCITSSRDYSMNRNGRCDRYGMSFFTSCDCRDGWGLCSTLEAWLCMTTAKGRCGMGRDYGDG
jgi:hypothetical protein